MLTIDPEYIGSWIPVCNRLPDLLDHRDEKVHSLAKQAILLFAETIAQQRPDVLVSCRLKIEVLLAMDRRSNRFVNSYPRALATLECLCAVGKWKIQDDENELVGFFSLSNLSRTLRQANSNSRKLPATLLISAA